MYKTSYYSSSLLSLIRDTVMKVMQDLDPSGVEQRRKRKLKRRVYRSKVYSMWSPQFSSPSYTVTTITIGDPTSCGTLMGMTSYLHNYGLTVHGCIDGYAYIARYNYTIQIIMFNTFMTDFHGRYCGWRWPQLITTPKWSHATIWIMLNNVEVYSNITVALSNITVAFYNRCFLYYRVPHAPFFAVIMGQRMSIWQQSKLLSGWMGMTPSQGKRASCMGHLLRILWVLLYQFCTVAVVVSAYP